MYKLFSNYTAYTNNLEYKNLMGAMKAADHIAARIIRNLTPHDLKVNARDYETINVHEVDADGEMLSDEAVYVVDLF